MNDVDQIVREFLVESYENLDQLDRDLVILEQEPDNPQRLASIFRTIHTIKGTAGFFGFAKLESLTHVGENLLSKLRDGELPLTPDITTTLLTKIDAVRQILGHIEAGGQEGDGDYSELIAQLTRLQESPGSAADPPPPDAAAAEQPPELIGELLVRTAHISPKQVDSALTQQAGGDPRHLGEILVEKGVVGPSEVVDALKTQQTARQGSLSEGNIRVDVALLDKLMNQVGELVLARNQILQSTAGQHDTALLSTTQRLNLITTELQEGVMKTRMQPIGNIWSKFPRVVRDLALQCGKKIRIEMEGKETELDKTIVEAIKDPLTHLVRNAVDHGIELPEARRAAGKPEEGCLLLRAFHEGGQVNIEITDDGGGLHLDRIRQKAIERGIVAPDQASRMSDRDAAMLIFAPGFSTAAQVTNVSGRGVGMDVVKTNVEKIGGAVDIQTHPGRGTTVRLKIPLTLAIIPAMIVSCGGARYAIPQVSLLELVRLEGEQARQGIERLHDAPVYRLRGQLLPVVYLRRELGIEASPLSAHAAAQGAEVVNMVVLRADDRQFGLVVDAINDTEEIVVKPLGKQLKGIPAYAGATIMGDGTVALILDVLGTAQRAHVVSETRDHNLARATTGDQERHGDRQTLLILAVGQRRLALPIALVSRLEEIPRSRIEWADHREVVQYRGQILPLVRLAEVLGIPAQVEDDEPLQVVVYSEGQRSVGLVVDRITDIVQATIDAQQRAQPGDLLASAVIQDRVTDLLNLPALIRKHDSTFQPASPAA